MAKNESQKLAAVDLQSLVSISQKENEVNHRIVNLHYNKLALDHEENDVREASKLIQTEKMNVHKAIEAKYGPIESFNPETGEYTVRDMRVQSEVQEASK